MQNYTYKHECQRKRCVRGRQGPSAQLVREKPLPIVKLLVVSLVYLFLYQFNIFTKESFFVFWLPFVWLQFLNAKIHVKFYTHFQLNSPETSWGWCYSGSHCINEASQIGVIFQVQKTSDWWSQGWVWPSYWTINFLHSQKMNINNICVYLC